MSQAFIKGLDEGQLAVHSALRRRILTGTLISEQEKFVSSTTVGGAAGASVLTWQSLTVTDAPIVWPTTLVARINQSATPASGTVALRVKGYDQFGGYQEEVTPFAAVAAKTNTYIYLGKVFSRVISAEWQSVGISAAVSTIELGTRYDWTRTNDASNEHVAGVNLGLGTTIEIGQTKYQPSGRYGIDHTDFTGDFDNIECQNVGYYDITGTSYEVVNASVGDTDASGWEGSLDKFRLLSASNWAVADQVILCADIFTRANARD